MSYDITLYTIETRQNALRADDPDFFEHTGNLEPFTPQQKEYLKNRLLKYGYQLTREDEHGLHFKHHEEEAVSVLLTNHSLGFQSSGSGIFEISMTASEFTDTGAFAKYDWQTGEWETL